jgi:hypothetical protein
MKVHLIQWRFEASFTTNSQIWKKSMISSNQRRWPRRIQNRIYGSKYIAVFGLWKKNCIHRKTWERKGFNTSWFCLRCEILFTVCHHPWLLFPWQFLHGFCEDARARFSFVGIIMKWLWSLPSLEWRKKSSHSVWSTSSWWRLKEEKTKVTVGNVLGSFVVPQNSPGVIKFLARSKHHDKFYLYLPRLCPYPRSYTCAFICN